MNITTFGFLVFIGASLLAYYLLPKRLRWYALLVSSALCILSASTFGFVFILFSAASIYFAALGMERLDQSKRPERKKPVLLLTIAANLGVLLALKFVPEILQILDGVLGTSLSAIRAPINRYLLPIGLSYYTLQALSYVLDVYWGRIPAETSFPKVLLFVSYFPQLVQGPISKYRQLAGELFTPRDFSVKNVKFGAQLMLWGYFKKLAIADNVAPYVSDIFYSGEVAYGPLVFIGLVCYGIQLYGDFSGGIDIIRGVSQCFGIELTQNFRQPFFSRSLAEFWRRWHISLGEWMKDYVFYPFSLSRPAAAIKKALKKRCSRKTASRIVIALGNLLVFTLVGVWHGTGSKYLGWGLYNGFILIFSSLMVDTYAKGFALTKIDRHSSLWQAFSLLRTFIIVTIGWVFDCADTAGGAIRMFLRMFQPHAGSLGAFVPPVRTVAALLFCLILLAVSILHEKKISVREALDQKPFYVQVIVWTALIQFIACFGRFVSSGGFMYANF